jgi:hypothetical protein
MDIAGPPVRKKGTKKPEPTDIRSNPGFARHRGYNPVFHLARCQLALRLDGSFRGVK